MRSDRLFCLEINSCFAKSAYIMISEGSCDTEDWSNDVENLALYHRKKYINIHSNRTVILICNFISQYWIFTLFLSK